MLQECHPENVNFVKEALETARRGEGPTLADTIIAIVKIHGPGGDEADDGIELELA